LSLVLLPPLLVAAGIANPLAVTLLGNQYSETGPVIVFGTMAMVFQILSQPYRQMLAGAEKMTLLVIGHALQFGVQAALLYGALSLIAAGQGILGPAPVTAMAMAGAALVGLAFWQAVVVRFLGAPADRALYIHLGSASGLFAVVYASNLLWTNRDIIAAILAFMAVVAHLGILRATGQLGQSEIAFLRELANPSRFRPSRLAVSPRRAA
jgi:hypothetical protein